MAEPIWPLWRLRYEAHGRSTSIDFPLEDDAFDAFWAVTASDPAWALIEEKELSGAWRVTKRWPTR